MQIYYDQDADLQVLAHKQLAVIGYGNQGQAQALNMRDSKINVLIGNIDDDRRSAAQADGFDVMSIADAARAADVLCFFLPDELQQSVYKTDIHPHMTPGKTINFAHGYNICYDLIQPPADTDVVMVAPRMIGVGVRNLFLAGSGAPVFVAVEQDATGHAWQTTLAIAKAIGATRVGALESTFAEETALDHFAEQAVWPTIVSVLTLAFEILTSRGYQPEAVIMDLYASGEAAEIFHEMAQQGLFRQMPFHSQTSQYGTLSRAKTILPDSFRDTLEKTIDQIKNGDFAREWDAERRAGYPNFTQLRKQAFAHPINQVEQNLKDALQKNQPHPQK